MPLRRLGLGSKRMLTTGLQKETLRTGHITLFDELEIGLEPHRIARLLDHLKNDTTGQYFLTTHSPVVLRELTVDDLHIVHSKGGKTDIVAANKPAIAGCIQGKVRLGAEAFLAPKIVVCEGATEVGLLRGFDDYWIEKKNDSFAYQGVALFDAGAGSAGVHVARGDLFNRAVGVLKKHSVSPQLTLSDAAERYQTQFRYRGRPIGRRKLIGTTLLVKGLEFDHAIVLDAASLPRKELYVALTRGAKSLSVVSSQPTLDPP
jgi:putative AbiEii toxin of type IV toxin-antitoxin system